MTAIKLALPLLLALAYSSAGASTAPFLGAAQAFAAAGAETVTNTGATSIGGDVGVWPGSSLTGAGTISGVGTVHLDDTVAHQAQLDGLAAYTFLAGKAATHDLSGIDLGSVGTLAPGVYRFSSSAQLTGHLTLDAGNDPNALFIFQIGSALTTAANASVNVLNGGANNGIFWDVGSSATLGSQTVFAGNILATQSVSLDTGAAILCGRAFGLHGSVTMQGNTIASDCGSFNGGTAASDYGSAGFSGGVSAVPEPGTLAMMGLGLLMMMPRLRRQPRSFS